MASLYKKVISGKPYWYLREMGWVDGKPKLVSERYLGTAADIEALLDAREAAVLPERTRHLAFGDVAAAWGVLQDLGVAAIIDEVTGARRSDAGASAGTYLALAALNRLVAPCSKAAFADWWKTTAADRFTKIPASVLDHRRFWDAMHAVTLGVEEEFVLLDPQRDRGGRAHRPRRAAGHHRAPSRTARPGHHHDHLGRRAGLLLRQRAQRRPLAQRAGQADGCAGCGDQRPQQRGQRDGGCRLHGHRLGGGQRDHLPGRLPGCVQRPPGRDRHGPGHYLVHPVDEQRRESPAIRPRDREATARGKVAR